MKRMIDTLLPIALFVLLCPLLVNAATVFTEGYFKYQIEEDSIIICEYYGKEAEVTVPSMMVGMPVSKIAKGAFSNNTSLKTVNLPDTVMTVERGAFSAGIQVFYNSNTDIPVASGSKNKGVAGSEGGQENTDTGTGQTENSESLQNEISKAGTSANNISGFESSGQEVSQNRENPDIEEVEAEFDGALFGGKEQSANRSTEERQIADQPEEEEMDAEESETEEREGNTEQKDKEKETEIETEIAEVTAGIKGGSAPIALVVAIIVAVMVLFFWMKRRTD